MIENGDKKQDDLNSIRLNFFKRLSTKFSEAFFSEEEIKQIKTNFLKYTNKDETLEKQQFKPFLKSLAINLSTKASNILYNYIDINSDGTIEFNEILKYWFILNKGDIKERIKFIFNVIDNKSKGYIEFQDINNYFDLLWDSNEKDYDKKLNSFLNFFYFNFNKNIEDKITSDEFVLNLKNNYELMEILNIFSEIKDLNRIEIDNVFNDLLYSIEKIIGNFDNLLISIYGKDSNNYKEFNKLKKMEKSNLIYNYVHNSRDSNSKKTFNLSRNITIKENDDNQEGENSILNSFMVQNKNKPKTVNYVKNILSNVKNLKIKIMNQKNEGKIFFDIKSNNASKDVKYFKRSWPFMICMMKGISKSILLENMIYEIIDVDHIEDYMTNNVFEIFPPTNEWFTKCHFHDYFSVVFKSIRDFLGVNSLSYNRTIGIKAIQNFFTNESLKEVLTEGKSLSFFYFSTDKKYLVKTIKKKEFLKLKKMLPSYYKYLKENNNTLISKYLGCHSLKLYNKLILKDEIFIVVMDNVFSNSLSLEEKYDLKGSTYKRGTPNFEKLDPKNFTKKDNDLIIEKKLFKISEVDKKFLKNIISKDALYLDKNNIIDYSLMVGVEKVDKDNKDKQQLTQYSFYSHDLNLIYHFGIIDTFTNYDILKKGEYAFKSIFQGKGISCKPPKIYSNRFIKFMDKIIIY